MDNLDAWMQACSDLGVATEPKIIDGVGIIPLFSWYHQVLYYFHVIQFSFLFNVETHCVQQ